MTTTQPTSSELMELNKKIQKMDEEQHIGILKIIDKYHRELINVNGNTSLVNLSLISDVCYKDLLKHVKFIVDQEKSISHSENTKEDLKKHISDHDLEPSQFFKENF